MDAERHKDDLVNVFERFKENSLKINLNKCLCGQNKLDFLDRLRSFMNLHPVSISQH